MAEVVVVACLWGAPLVLGLIGRWLITLNNDALIRIGIWLFYLGCSGAYLWCGDRLTARTNDPTAETLIVVHGMWASPFVGMAFLLGGEIVRSRKQSRRGFPVNLPQHSAVAGETEDGSMLKDGSPRQSEGHAVGNGSRPHR